MSVAELDTRRDAFEGIKDLCVGYCTAGVEEKLFTFPMYPTSPVQESIQTQTLEYLSYGALAFWKSC